MWPVKDIEFGRQSTKGILHHNHTLPKMLVPWILCMIFFKNVLFLSVKDVPVFISVYQKWLSILVNFTILFLFYGSLQFFFSIFTAVIWCSLCASYHFTIAPFFLLFFFFSCACVHTAVLRITCHDHFSLQTEGIADFSYSFSKCHFINSPGL